MLIGQYETTTGDKNRIAVPKKLRTELGSRMIIAKWYESCLVLVSEANWKMLISRITGEVRMITSSVRDTDRFILGSAFDAETDSQGRFVIPSILKTYAKLDKEVIFLGLGDRVEIWNKSEWLKREEYITKQAASLLDNIAKSDVKA